MNRCEKPPGIEPKFLKAHDWGRSLLSSGKPCQPATQPAQRSSKSFSEAHSWVLHSVEHCAQVSQPARRPASHQPRRKQRARIEQRFLYCLASTLLPHRNVELRSETPNWLKPEIPYHFENCMFLGFAKKLRMRDAMETQNRI